VDLSKIQKGTSVLAKASAGRPVSLNVLANPDGKDMQTSLDVAISRSNLDAICIHNATQDKDG
jgi:hypothetical protein